MKHPLRILITNNTLAQRSGTELYVKDLSLALIKAGHLPVAYSQVLGEVADDLKQATIPVISNLDDLREEPHIIHGHHHLETMTAVLHFPATPAIFMCHEWYGWMGCPPSFPTIRRYIGVSDLLREKILTSSGIDPGLVDVLYNFVDKTKIIRKKQLPDKIRKSLVFSNYAKEGEALETIRHACRRCGIEQLDIIGAGIGNAVKEPGKALHEYDLVFATGRCALEAAAAGCSVIASDFSGLGGMVTTENMRQMRSFNFAIRSLQNLEFNTENLADEINKYDREDATKVSQWIWQDAGICTAVDRLIDIYHDAISTSSPESNVSGKIIARHASDYIQKIVSPQVKELQKGIRHYTDQKDLFEEEIKSRDHHIAQLEQELDRVQEINNRLEQETQKRCSFLKKIRSVLGVKN